MGNFDPLVRLPRRIPGVGVVRGCSDCDVPGTGFGGSIAGGVLGGCEDCEPDLVRTGVVSRVNSGCCPACLRLLRGASLIWLGIIEKDFFHL